MITSFIADMRQNENHLRQPKASTLLSKQQLKCARLVQQNLSYKEVAKLISLSPRTVEKYMTVVKEKLGIVKLIQLKYIDIGR